LRVLETTKMGFEVESLVAGLQFCWSSGGG
jgi:hypothetical protein